MEDSLRRQGTELEKLRKENERLTKENEKLKKELAARRQPPKWAKANKSLEQKKRAKKKGPKFGHRPHNRRRPEKIDETVVVFPERCPRTLVELAFPSDSKWYSHIQIDLPEPRKVVVTEYIVGSSYCSQCRCYHSATGRIANSLYGPRLHAQVCYWKFELGLTLPKIQKNLKSEYDLELSTGQISEIIARTAQQFEGAYDDLKTGLTDQTHLHVDETGWRVDGDNAWLWSFSNDDVSVYTIDDSRSQQVVADVLGEVFSGVLCSDFYGAYNKIDCVKQKCWAHILRELRNLKKAHPKNVEIAYFASRLKCFFERGKILREDHAAGKDVTRRIKRLHGESQRFALRKFKNKDLQTLAKRLVKYRHELYTFIEKDLEPTNNQAEREVRPAVLMRKTSYGNRSTSGAHRQAILMTMIRTSQKQGLNFVRFASDYLTR